MTVQCNYQNDMANDGMEMTDMVAEPKHPFKLD